MAPKRGCEEVSEDQIGDLEIGFTSLDSKNCYHKEKNSKKVMKMIKMGWVLGD